MQLNARLKDKQLVSEKCRLIVDGAIKIFNKNASFYRDSAAEKIIT